MQRLHCSKKKRPVGPCFILICATDAQSCTYGWCLGPESNRHARLWAADFKSDVSTNFTTEAATLIDRAYKHNRCKSNNCFNCTGKVYLSRKKRKLKLPFKFGAGNRVRTDDLYLGKVSLYQLSYSRLCTQLLGWLKFAASKPLKTWSGKSGSNRRPIPWQGIALPTELFPHFGGAIRSRTGLDGFAIRCITALLSRQPSSN